jgi:hypothetical protein
MSNSTIKIDFHPPLTGITDDGNAAGVAGINNDKFNGPVGGGVVGISNVHGVHGISRPPTTLSPPNSGTGVFGESDRGVGVYGSSGINAGVRGESNRADGILGISRSSEHAGVSGVNNNGGFGVFGISRAGTADASTGVFGESDGFDGVRGMSHANNHAGVSGINDNGGVGVFGQGATAGLFFGNVKVAGNLEAHDVVLSDGSDCAEDFDISGVEQVEAGTVMVIDQEGSLQQSQQAYDKRVAGVISGAGNYKPAITLDKQQTRNGDKRQPVALLGKVYCKVDAQYAPVEVGDLLTTSPTPGYAMKAGDPLKAFGAVIGKALRPLATGQGLIPILIALQ